MNQATSTNVPDQVGEAFVRLHTGQLFGFVTGEAVCHGTTSLRSRLLAHGQAGSHALHCELTPLKTLGYTQVLRPFTIADAIRNALGLTLQRRVTAFVGCSREFERGEA